MNIDSRESPTIPWHAWRRPDVSIARVFACAVYVVPGDMDVKEGWEERCVSMLRDCANFHHKEFPSSRLEWSLHGPLFLPFAAAKHRNDPDGFYDAMAHEVRSAARDGVGGSLPPPVACSMPFDDATANAPYIPTIVDFVCFADWGQDLTNPAKLRKYYIGQYVEKLEKEQTAGLIKAQAAAAEVVVPSGNAAVGSVGMPAAAATPSAEPEAEGRARTRTASDSDADCTPSVATAQAIDLSDITMAGGSRSSFTGRLPRSEVVGIPPFSALVARFGGPAKESLPPPPPAMTPSGAPRPVPTPLPLPDGAAVVADGAGGVAPTVAASLAASASTAAASFTPSPSFWASPVGVGLGLVTQEAWYHPEARLIK